MQRTVGVRELRAGVSRVLRRVRENRESVNITYRGQVIARIVPVVPSAEAAETLNTVWADVDQLAREIGQHWKPPAKSAAQAVREGRRE